MTLSASIEARYNAFNEAWQLPAPQAVKILNIQKTVQITDYKGEVLPTTSDYRVGPSGLFTPNDNQVNLASTAISLAGSFAPTVTDAGFTYVPGTDRVTVFYDGTNNSKRIKQRRADGYAETLPGGSLTIQGLTPSAAGAAQGPTYGLLCYYTPGSCQLSWIVGNAGSPQFAFAGGIVTADALAAQRSRGREMISDGAMLITLLPVPAVAPVTAPPVGNPGTTSGNSATNGTLTVTVDAPGSGATVDLNSVINAHSTDTTYTPTGWQIFVDGQTTPFYDNPGPTSSVSVPISLTAGSHTIVLKGWDSAGTMAQVTVTFNVSDLSGSTTAPAPTPVTTVNPTPIKPPACVMLGTALAPLGPSPWHYQQMAQHEWVRIYSSRGRELIGTPDCRIYIGRSGLTELRDIRKGDMAVCEDGEDMIVIKPEVFQRPGVKVVLHMDWGHLAWANGFLMHNVKIGQL